MRSRRCTDCCARSSRRAAAFLTTTRHSSCFTSRLKMPECAGDETLNGPQLWASLPFSSANVFLEPHDDDHTRHRGTDNDRSARTLAVKSRACGAPYRASGLDRSVRPSKVADRADDARLSMDRNQTSPFTEIPYTKLRTLPAELVSINQHWSDWPLVGNSN